MLPKVSIKELPVWKESPKGEWGVDLDKDSTLSSFFRVFGTKPQTEKFNLQELFALKTLHVREIKQIERMAIEESYPAEQIDQDCKAHNQQIQIIEDILEQHPDYPFEGGQEMVNTLDNQ